MNKFEFNARNGEQLSKQIDDSGLTINFGLEGNKSTWFAHAEYGARLKTGLTFEGVVNYCNEEAAADAEFKDRT